MDHSRTSYTTNTLNTCLNLWTAEYYGVRNHVRLFLETNSKEDGTIHHVIGTVFNGMTYRTRSGESLDTSASYVPGSKKCIGTIGVDDIKRLETICETVPPPEKQMRLNGSRIDPSKPVRRCGDRVREVIDELHKQDILKVCAADDESQHGSPYEG